ncbi:hypothetical protein AKJ65_00930 [candidate division MSBL1 archaeon SCGC-AAA259E19]|uniref:Large ribosomal subunit protein eL20 n=1 Tax=candidate division MSBL1 archaeon SCGC-AAA259E19 TaxID=1698264 RepID=A0A133UNL2_9EURY|nr:hypothetical protein AKJ65_00930 [candidate division MSBL1 archaeon SCGC-AAA259E19]
MGKIFRIKGWFKKKRNKMEFTKEISSDSKDRAVEILYSDLGSRHAVKRSLVHISEIEELEPEDT